MSASFDLPLADSLIDSRQVALIHRVNRLGDDLRSSAVSLGDPPGQ